MCACGCTWPTLALAENVASKRACVFVCIHYVLNLARQCFLYQLYIHCLGVYHAFSWLCDVLAPIDDALWPSDDALWPSGLGGWLVSRRPRFESRPPCRP